MAIVGSDFHGNLSKTKRFLEYKPKIEHIFAGDILDSWDKTPQEQSECLDLLLDSTCKLIWGNHEQSYWADRRPCSGFKWQWYDTFCARLENNRSRFTNAILVDNYIVTHAGIGDDYEEFDDPELQVDELNNEKGILKIYSVGYSRGGNNPQGGIFWFDHLSDGKLAKKYNQVFGHTASEEPVEYKGDYLGKSYHHICVNTRDTSDRMWVFNTKTKLVEEVI